MKIARGLKFIMKSKPPATVMINDNCGRGKHLFKPHQLNQDYMYFVQLPYYHLVYVIANYQLPLYSVEQDQHELNTKKYLPIVISGIK